MEFEDRTEWFVACNNRVVFSSKHKDDIIAFLKGFQKTCSALVTVFSVNIPVN